MVTAGDSQNLDSNQNNASSTVKRPRPKDQERILNPKAAKRSKLVRPKGDERNGILVEQGQKEDAAVKKPKSVDGDREPDRLGSIKASPLKKPRLQGDEKKDDKLTSVKEQGYQPDSGENDLNIQQLYIESDDPLLEPEDSEPDLTWEDESQQSGLAFTYPSPDVQPQNGEQDSEAESGDASTWEEPQGESQEDRRQAAYPSPYTEPESSEPEYEPADSFWSVQEQEEKDFMDWCKKVLGIHTILEIQIFEYYDYMKALPAEDWEEENESDRIPVDSLPMIQVRGLAASRDIEEGETVIKIPLQALLSVATTVDQDPVLSGVMGPEARQAQGWTTNTGDEASYLEMPFLAVALLHHKRLGAASPLSPYLRILESNPVDSMPFLWSEERLRSEVSEGIRTVARDMQREIQEMYSSIVEVLIKAHPEVFGPDPNSDEWLFSFESFQWAFATINSRHWQLPIRDLGAEKPSEPIAKSRLSEEDQQGTPPASMPTDVWVKEHEDAEDDAFQTETSITHSFLAPVADLLNFGPPCTRGSYDKESRTFEIIATCSFRKGQEVTFWYSDECDHVMVGVYGFMHPIVPPCPTAEEYRRRSEEWRLHAEDLERRLTDAYEDLDMIDSELQQLRDILRKCDCCKYDEEKSRTSRSPRRDSESRSETVRGGVGSSHAHENIERHGVRSRWRDRGASTKSEF